MSQRKWQIFLLALIPFVFSSFGFFLFQHLTKVHRSGLDRLTDEILYETSLRISTQLTQTKKALNRMALRLDQLNPDDLQDWRLDAIQYLKDFKRLESLEIQDYQGNQLLRVGEVVSDSAVSSLVTKTQSGHTLVAKLSYAKVFDEILGPMHFLTENFNLEAYENDQLVFKNKVDASISRSDFRKILVEDLQIRAFPSKKILQHEVSLVPHAALIVFTVLGFALSGLLLTLFWYRRQRVQLKDHLEKSRDEESLQSSILNSLNEGVVVANRKGHFVKTNESAELILRTALDPVPLEQWGERFGTFKSEELEPYPPDELPLAKAIEGESSDPERVYIKHNETDSGFWIEVSGAPWISDDGKLLGGLVVYRDIDDLVKHEKELESSTARLMSTSRLASIGEMAGGIAHEINNPLTVILSKVEMTLEDIENQDLNEKGLQSDLEKIRSLCIDMAGIIRNLRSISRDVANDPFEKTNLKQIFQSVSRLCREKIRYLDINFEVHSPPKGVFLSCRPTEIQQVLLNLIANARDAVEELQEKWITVQYEQTDEDVTIQVRDSGPGIESDVKDKLFQPFFTTKDPNKGTGLGLSLSRAIVQRHGGSLELDETSKYTCFILRLPKTQDSSADQKAS